MSLLAAFLYVCVFCHIVFSCDDVLCVFFFFQAEDGIRDHCVTGVQTCALPISERRSSGLTSSTARRNALAPTGVSGCADQPDSPQGPWAACTANSSARASSGCARAAVSLNEKIGRASCREREEISAGAGIVEKE